MGRTRLEKPKPITPYGTRKEPNKKKTIGRPKTRWENVFKNYVEEL